VSGLKFETYIEAIRRRNLRTAFAQIARKVYAEVANLRETGTNNPIVDKLLTS